MKKIAVIGSGYVGLVTGTCFAELGNQVVCVDANESRVAKLRAGEAPFYEPGLSELLVRNHAAGRLSFTTGTGEAVRASAIVFIAVGTPMDEDGHADLSQVCAAAKDIAASLNGDKIVVNKSTVPVETGDLVSAIIREHASIDAKVRVVSNPEFLREGSAIGDFMHPDRIVIGVDNDDEVLAEMQDLYAPLNAPIIATDVRTAEMIKYTSNAFLATKISFINEIARICDRFGADVRNVVAGAGADKRIGTAFMNPGLGFGGSCFPKDVSALCMMARSVAVSPVLLSATLEVNREQIGYSVERIAAVLGDLNGKRAALLGLAFKPETDDVRESPAIAMACALRDRGAQLVAHDPIAVRNASALPNLDISYAGSLYEAANDADVLVIATDWNEYKQLDFGVLKKLMRFPFIFDGRNIYDPEKVTAQGFTYAGVGRGGKLQPAPHTAGRKDGVLSR